MKLKPLLVSLVATAAVVFGMPATAHAAGGDDITVTAADIDVTANACFLTSLKITGLTRIGVPYVVVVYRPNGDQAFAISWGGYPDTPPLVAGFCSDMIEGHYTIQIDGVTYGGFEVYRPHLDAAVAPASRSADRRKHYSRRAVAHLTIHGQPMANQQVIAHRHVSGHHGTRMIGLRTDGNGNAYLKCPKRHRCTIQFDYGNGFASSKVVRVRR